MDKVGNIMKYKFKISLDDESDSIICIWLFIKGKGKVQPCTGTEAQYRPYGP